MKTKDKISNPDVAVCFDSSGSILTAACLDGAGGIYVEHLPADDNLYNSIVRVRADFGAKTDEETVFRYVPFLFTEQTKILALSDDQILLGDSELVKFLNSAMQSDLMAADGKPFFKKGEAAANVYDFARLPSGDVSLTELPREILELSSQRVASAASKPTAESVADDNRSTDYLQAVETQMRVIARFLSVEKRDYFESLKQIETVAFFSFLREGYAFALWNPTFGFFVELGEVFDVQVANENVPEGVNSSKQTARRYLEAVYNFVNEQFYHRVVPEDENIPPLDIKNIFWLAEEGMREPVAKILAEFSKGSGFPLEYVGNSRSEMVVAGLLYGSLEEETELVPAINLANDLTIQNEIISEIEAEEVLEQSKQRRAVAGVFMLIPILCAFGLVIGLHLNNWRIAVGIESRRMTATDEIARLKPLLDSRAEYEKTLSWYEDVLRQIIALRAKQSSSLLFAARLDPLYPETNSFFISELKLLPGGDFEIKGLARDEQAVTDFVKSLEFASGTDNTRYFTNLTVGFKQGSAISEETGSAASEVAGNLSAGISGFSIKGNFPTAGVIKPQAENVVVQVPATPVNTSVQTPATTGTSGTTPVTPNQEGSNPNQKR